MGQEHVTRVKRSRYFYLFLYPSILFLSCFPLQLSANNSNSDVTCQVTLKNTSEPPSSCNTAISRFYQDSRKITIINEDQIVTATASDHQGIAIAIEGREIDDSILNHGEIHLQVSDKGEVLSSWLQGDNEQRNHGKQWLECSADYEYPRPKLDWISILEGIHLDAVGIVTWYGHDIVRNTGLLDVAASTTLNDEPGFAHTYAIGIMGFSGGDELVNEGQLNVVSSAEITIDDVSFDLIDEGDIFRQAVAVAEGISGGVGRDEIVNSGVMEVTANSTVDTSEFSLTLIEGLVDVDAANEAWASATGIHSGAGGDLIINSGTLNVSANALAHSDNVSIDLIDLGGTETVRAPLSAHALAIGIDGDGGDELDDQIHNSGTLNVTSNATADALDVQITGLSFAEGGANTLSDASAIGINGSSDWDQITNDGNISVSANATTHTDALDVTVFDLSFLVGSDDRDEQVLTRADAQATGIVGGNGDDQVSNNASLQVQSNAKVDVDDFAVRLLGLESDVNRTASAGATGITGDAGNDTLISSGQMEVESNATLDILSLSFDVLGGATNVSGESQSLASAVGFDGGQGHDDIFNLGTSSVDANASINSADVNVSLISGLQGQVIRAPIHAQAEASGILGGEGYDLLGNSGTLNVNADAKAHALDMDFSAVDLSSGGLSTSSQASVIGIDGGEEISEVSNSGDTVISSSATTNTEKVSVTLVDLSLVSDIIDLIFQTPVDTSTTSQAEGVGIRTDDESDLISNAGSLSVTTAANTRTFEFSLSSDGVSNFTDLTDFPDFFRNTPMMDIGTRADASVIGISSGAGHDEISNSGSLIASTSANVSAISVGIDPPLLPELLPGILGALPNIDTTEVETSAAAQASGIDSGTGYDTIFNEGSVHSEAAANASSLSVNATVDFDIPTGGDDDGGFELPSISLEANLVDVGAQSEASALGINTGQGEDWIKSKDVTAKASAQSLATNIAVTLAFPDDNISVEGSLANASTESKAKTEGINTGQQDDLLTSSGTLLADSFAESISTTVTAKVQAVKDTWIGIGASVTKANTTADSSSQAVILGEGNDSAINDGAITAKAHNNSDAVGVDVAVTVPADDKFSIIGEGNWVSADTLASATADGILGGQGDDDITNNGSITADSRSDPDSVGVAVTASGTKKGVSLGIALAQAKTAGTASSSGIRGGEAEDRLLNTGTVNSKATTDTVAVSVAASLALTDKGVSLTGTAVDGSTSATTNASGMTGDQGQDLVANEGAIDVLADADATSVSVSVSAQGANKGVGLGLALSRATSQAEANSQGMSGGTEDDVLHSSGTVKSHATADVIAGSGALAGGGTSKGLTVEGAAADGSTTGKAGASGISGDEGEDLIVNSGDVDVLADVHATSVSVGATANGTGQGVTIGVALGRATSTSEADSAGISGGEGLDLINNSGKVKSHAKSNVIAGSGALAAGGASKGITVEGAGVDAATLASSSASGISGDAGQVEILNKGDLDVLADADATSVSAAVSANGTGTGVTFGLGLARATSDASASSVGIVADQYDDDIYSEGAVKSHALSNVIAGSGALAAGGSGKGLTIEGAGADGSTRSEATAVGIEALQGADRIVSKGDLDVLADADATSVSVSASANGTGTGLAVGVAVARARSDAEAESIGINAGDGHDIIISSGSIKSHAKSLVIAGSGGLAAGGTGKGVTAELAGSDAATLGISSAVGISGGQQCDYLYSEDSVDVLADVSATSVSVAASGNFAGTGVSFGLGLARASTTGDALSIGLDGGDDHDQIFSLSTVKSHALSNVIAGSGGLAFGGTGKGVAIEAAGADAGTEAVSKALGIDGGEGEDLILSEGLVDVLADSKATSVSVSASANGSGAGVTLGLGLARAQSLANADSIGISGGAEGDEISSKGKVKSHAKATVTAGSGALAGGGTGKGVAIEGAAADGLSRGYVSATGISGGDGDDVLQSEGELDVYAKAKTTSVSVAVSANGTGVGLTAGVALARAASEAEANSKGISGGANNDDMLNTLKLKSHAIADVDAVSVSAAMGGAGKGVAIQGAAADASTVGTANSVGISGDDGLDKIFNEGELDVLADADSTSVSVAASVSGTGAGVGLGVSVARADTQAFANATGISLGGANDELTEEDKTQPVIKQVDEKPKQEESEHCGAVNKKDLKCNDNNPQKEPEREPREIIQYVVNSGKITSKAQADADSASVSVQLGITGVGLQAGGAIALAGTQANAKALGIEGSNHNDVIINKNSINASSDADATTTSVGVSLNADIKGATLSVAVTDATATGDASSTGIAGLQGDDAIDNQGAISSKAKAETNAISVSVPIGIAFVPLSVGIADNDATATSNAIGLDGGLGNDFLQSSASILSDADSDAFGISVSVAPIGVSLAYANVTADASATGVDGGAGDDDIHLTETAAVTAKSNSEATGTVITATLLGVAGTIFDENEVTASSQSSGISAGDGVNRIVNLASINSTASSKSIGTSVSAGLSGATFASMETEAISHSKGISGGANSDLILNQGAIHVSGRSQTTGTSVGATVDPLSFTDTGSRSESYASGIAGYQGDDQIKSTNAVSVDANAIAKGTSVGVALRYAAFSDTSTDATTRATGISGGAGSDQMEIDNSVHSKAKSTATGTSVSAALIGATFADTSSKAESYSSAVAGDEGDDHLENLGNLRAEATSTATGTSVSAALVGAAFSDLSTESTSNAIGIDMGANNDKVINLGTISANAQSIGGGTSVAAGLVGYFDADAGTRIDANATGVDLGSGDDVFLSEGNLAISAGSKATVTAGSGTLAGAATAKANIGSSVNAWGLSAGAGNDMVVNEGSITVGAAPGGSPWMSQLTSNSFTFSLLGAAISESSLYAETRSGGLDGGSGNDQIYNTGKLSITSRSNSATNSTSIAIFGAALGGGTAGAISDATGIAGGDGDNVIGNSASIDVNSTALATLDAVSFTFAGASSAKNKLSASTNAWGIVSGSGNDILSTEGLIDIDVVSTLSSNTNSSAVFGASDAGAVSGAETIAFGIDSGAGDDFIHNLSSIDLYALPTVNLNASAFTLGGSSNSGGTLTSQAQLTGIASGSGSDWVQSDEKVKVRADSALNISSSSLSVVGAANAGGSGKAVVTAYGIDVGDQNDVAVNKANIEVDSSVKMKLTSGTFNFGGASSASGSLVAQTLSLGINSGSGDDWIDNQGKINIKTSADLDISSDSKIIFGSASADTVSSADPRAIGIDAGSGNDVVWNDADISVSSKATTKSNKTSYAFAGGSQINSMLGANAKSIGINTGSGDDELINKKHISVNSTSTLTATGGARTDFGFGSAPAAAIVSSSSQVEAMVVGSGNDRVLNQGNISGTAKSNSNSVTDANAGVYFSDGISRSVSIISSVVHGISASSGDNIIFNDGDINLNASGKSYADSDSDGDTIDNFLGVDQNAYAITTATARRSEAIGILAGDGDNLVENVGNININVTTEAFSDSYADGDAIISGDGTAHATSRANNAKAYGIKLGHGDNWVLNRGTITVKTKPRVNAVSNSDADGIPEITREPDSKAFAYAYADNALAIGISAGNGDNEIINQGTLNVESAPNANKAYAFGGYGGDVLGVDSWGWATASANNAKAYGIEVGHGDNNIWNLGTISVAAKPRAIADGNASGIGRDGDADARAYANADNALAVGIITGNGDNTVINKGVINVTATPYAYADAWDSPSNSPWPFAGEGVNIESASVTNAQAIGIWTGSGDDLIVNENSISVNATGSSPVKVAIRSGAGNDTVNLSGVSSTIGNIDLGANNDTIQIFNTPTVNGRIFGGSGVDTVIYVGSGTFSNPLEPDFENVIKREDGTYTVTTLPSMQTIFVEQGTLEINSDYEFAVGSNFTPSISSGSGGQLVINGALSISAASIDIMNGIGHHLDGAKHTVLQAAGGIVDTISFDAINVPDKTPLLEFTPQVNADSIQIGTTVKPFKTVALCNNERAIASYMDGLLVDAEGEISQYLGEFQALQAGQHARAFESMNPASYIDSQQVLQLGMKQHNATLMQRVRGLRYADRYQDFIQPGFITATAAPTADSVSEILNQSYRGFRSQGSWLKSSISGGQSDVGSGLTGFDHHRSGYAFGFDQWIDEHRVVGLSVGEASADRTAAGDYNRDSIDSQLVSLYGSYFNDIGFVDATITSGFGEYNSNRYVSVGAIDGTAFSEHDSSAYSSVVSGGLFIPVPGWDTEIYTALSYQKQDDDAFEEEGVGGIGLSVKSRKSESLNSEVGVRAAKHINNRRSRLHTELGLAWLHQINDDSTIEASFIDAPNSTFTVEGRDYDDNGVAFSAGVSYLNDSGFSASTEFRSEVRDDFEDQTFSAKLQFLFD